MFLSLIFSLCRPETRAEVQEIFTGNWTVIESRPGEESFDAVRYRFNVSLAARSTLSARLFDLNGALVRNLTVVFVNASKGTFAVLEGRRLLANFDFSPHLPPHIESSGAWDGGRRYHAVMVNNRIMQLTVFGNSTDGDDMAVYTFDKLVDEAPVVWYDRYFKHMFMAAVGVLSILLNVFLQSCKIRRYEEEERKKLEKQEKKKNKKKTK